MSDKEGLGNKPLIVIVGLIASCIAIFAFVTGKQSLNDIISSNNTYNYSSPTSTIAPAPINTSIQPDSSNVRGTATLVPPPTSTEIIIPPTIFNKRVRAKDGATQVYIPVEMGFGGFWIDQTEITGNQYSLCINGGVCDHRGEGIGGEYPAAFPGNWAKDYCEWAGARLPTRDEWLRAATGVDGRIWPWGNQWNEKKANTSSGYDGKGLLPVGSLPSGASPYGVLEMAGNAFEWVIDSTCEDGFRLQGTGSYASAPEDFSPSSSRCLNPANSWENTGARCAENDD